MRTIILILASFLPIAAQTQTITTSLSDKFESKIIWNHMAKMGDRFIRFEFTGAGFTGENESVGIELIQYDSLLNETKRVKLSDGEKIYRRRLANLVSINNKVFFLYQLADKKNIMDVMAVEVNPVDLTTGTPKTIAITSKADPKSSLFDFRNYQKCYMAVSPNEKRVSLLIPAKEYFWCSVLDENMNIVAEKKIDINYTQDNYFESNLVDDKGNVYVALIVYPPKKEQKEIRIYDINGGQKNFPVDLGESIGKKITIVLSRKTNTLLFAGSYNNTLSIANMLGTFTGSINLNDFKYNLSPLIPFPDSTLSILDNDGWANTGRKNHGIHYEYWPQIYESEDGSLQMTAQLQKSPFASGKNYMLYGGIMYIHYGAVNNYLVIPRYRLSTAWGSIGGIYLPVPYKNKLILLYNDNPRNVNRDNDIKPKNSSDASDCVLVAATIEQNGALQRDIVSDMRDDSYIAVLETCYTLQPFHFLVPMQKVGDAGMIKGSMRWMRIDVK